MVTRGQMYCKTFIDIWIPLELAADGFAEPLLSTSELDHQTYSVDRPNPIQFLCITLQPSSFAKLLLTLCYIWSTTDRFLHYNKMSPTINLLKKEWSYQHSKYTKKYQCIWLIRRQEAVLPIKAKVLFDLWMSTENGKPETNSYLMRSHSLDLQEWRLPWSNPVHRHSPKKGR